MPARKKAKALRALATEGMSRAPFFRGGGSQRYSFAPVMAFRMAVTMLMTMDAKNALPKSAM